jgi:hypothetical protein
MKEVNYPPLKIVVTGNDEPVVLPPDRAEFDQLCYVSYWTDYRLLTSHVCVTT